MKKIRGNEMEKQIRRKCSLMIVSVTLVVMLFGVSSGFALQRVTEAATTDGFTETLVSELAASGFQVSQGYPMLYPLDACFKYTYPLFGSCFGNNPAAPYVMPVVKSWPDEYVDPATANAFGETRPGFSATYRLDPREAIVIYGQMPPPGRYMGLQTIDFSEHGMWKPKDYSQWANTPDLPFPMPYLFGTIPPDDPKSKRVRSLSALGDIVNNVVMERQSGYPFGETRYFIITPSATTDNAVRRALQAQGVIDSHVFTEKIPSMDDFGPIGPLGMGQNAIDFLTLFRYALPNSGQEAAAKEWRKNPPLTVLRVRAPSSLGQVQRYGSLTFEPQTAMSEAYLAAALQNLVQAVCDNVSGNSSFTSTECVQPPAATSFMSDLVHDYGWTGPYCRALGMDCQADQRDAGYFFSSPLPVDAGQVHAVVGTLATKTGNATYAALSINDASMMAGVENILDTTLEGSAAGYVPTEENKDKFFVRYFTKDCAVLEKVPGGMENCSPTVGVEPPIGDLTLQGVFIIGLRNYIAPGTQRGPSTTELLRPRVLTFTQQP
jgi:hypothetical protein